MDQNSQKYEFYVSDKSQATIDALIAAGKVSSTAEAILLAVELGLAKIAEDDDFEGLVDIME